MTKFQRQIAAWGTGIEHEIGFWSQISTKGLSWPDDYLRRVDPNTPIDRSILH